MNTSATPEVKNARLKARALELLPMLSSEDQRKFRRKFESESAHQAAHSARELFLGIFLRKNGFVVKYEIPVMARTPDWAILNDDSSIQAIVEQLTFHQVPGLDKEMNIAILSGQEWVDWMPDNTPRLYQKLHEKADRYASIADAAGVAYLIAVFADFFAAVDREQLDEALFKAYGGGVYADRPSLSGVIFCQESNGRYAFEYIPNPSASRPLLVVGCQV